MIHRIKQELSQLSTYYRKDSATREHYRILQRLMSRMDGSENSGNIDDPKQRFMVTISKEVPELDSFAVLAGEVSRDEKLRMLEFKHEGRTVVQIAEELVESYMEPA